MDVERAREFMLTLPHVVETQQWGDNLLFWAGEKAIGGKMFCMLDLAPGKHGVVAWLAGPERYPDLLERDGLLPAPYFARIFWVAAERWGALRNAEWEEEWRGAHALTVERLAPKAKRALGLLPPPKSSVKAAAKAVAKRKGK